MTGWVIRDYFDAFRWRNSKDIYQSNKWFIYFYFLIILPMISGELRSMEGWTIYILNLVPLLFTTFSEYFHPMALPKLMYLCPMSRDMRREYIVKSCCIRVAVPVVMSIVVVTVLLITGKCDGIYGLTILLNHIAFSVFFGAGININGYGKKDEKGQRVVNMNTGNGILEGINIAISLINCFMTSIYITYGMESESASNMKWLFLTCSIVSVLLTWRYTKDWSESVERAIQYETSAHCNDANAPVKMRTSDLIR